MIPRIVKLRDICDVDSLDGGDLLSMFREEIGEMEWARIEFIPRRLDPDAFGSLMTADGMTSSLDAFTLHAEQWQRELVDRKAAHFDRERILICRGNLLVDGNHHLVAAHRLGEPVWIVDLDEPEQEAELEIRL